MFDRCLDGTIDRGKQVAASGVHLTVAEVLFAHSMGRLDFGGSEFDEARFHPVQTMEQSPTDRYAWWRLKGGLYGVRFNEALKDGAPCCLLVANARLLAAGCALAAALCQPGGVIRSVLTVPECGVRIKQNARIALLRPPR